jgi:beta-N-acetylhexosaminidase
LFVGIDQEGGRVCRLKQRDGFCPAAGAAWLGCQDTKTVIQEVETAAAQLVDCGINLNFAPVVDLALNPESPAIGRHGRSYGTDPDRVVACARAVIEAHHRHGVGCCLKHFPGHGSAGGDSHLGFVDVTDCWQAIELEPYRQLIAAGYHDGVMTAHLVHRRLDDSGLPATLSPLVMTDLLRRELGFGGVVFSDDLQMRAIRDGWSYQEAVQLAVMAGVDVLVVGNNLVAHPEAVQQGVRAINELLDSGRVERARIHASLARIARFKQTIVEQSWNPLVPPTTV